MSAALSRRGFLASGVASAGSLVIGFHLPSALARGVKPDDTVELRIARSEMGQRLWGSLSTGRSRGIRESHQYLREGGAKARMMLMQAAAAAHPLYRLEWQGLGSQQRRLRNCMAGARAEAFAYGSQERLALAFHLKQRAAGMTWEASGLRP